MRLRLAYIILSLALFLSIVGAASAEAELHWDAPTKNSQRLSTWIRADTRLPIPQHYNYRVSHDIALCDALLYPGVRQLGGCYWEYYKLIVVRPYKWMYHYAFIFFHEIGHAFDYAYLTEHNRSVILKMFKKDSWRVGPHDSQMFEKFANEYAKCIQWRIKPLQRLPLARKKKVLCRYIIRIYRRGPVVQYVNEYPRKTTAS